MCAGVAVLESELPWDMAARLGRRLHRRGEGLEGELRFLYRDRDPELPVWHDGTRKLVRWGSRDRKGQLPTTGWTWKDTVASGGWEPFGAVPVDIICSLGYEKGVWFRVRQGIRGLLVADELGEPRVYMLCEPATRYYRIMTRSERMPVLIEDVI